MEACAYFNHPQHENGLNWVCDPNISGFVCFTQKDILSPVLVSINITGLEDGYHGIHIHNKPLTPQSLQKKNPCNECCSHFNGNYPLWSLENPNGTPHGRHLGDLCFNILSKRGKVLYQFYDPKISLYPDLQNSIRGKSVVIHKEPDDLGVIEKPNLSKIPIEYLDERDIESLKTGNAGKRLACSNIVLF